ncbi:unnamed protein product, partial [marine sediment metagenome]
MAVNPVGSSVSKNETTTAATISVDISWDPSVNNGGIIVGVAGRMDRSLETFTSLTIDGQAITTFVETSGTNDKFARIYTAIEADLPVGSGTVTITATFGQNENWRYVAAQQVENLDQSTPFTGSVIYGDTNTVITLNVTNDGVDELCFGICHDSQDVGLSKGSGDTLVGVVGTGSSRSAGMSYEQGNIGLSTQLQWTATASTFGRAIGIALNHAGGPTAGGNPTLAEAPTEASVPLNWTT